MNIQEWCEYCSEVSYFRQVIPNILSFNNSYLSLFCTHDKVYCELCDKRWSSYLSKNGQDCYQFFSGWVKSTLTKKSISILNLPWWDNCNKCLVCELELKYIHQHSESYYQKWKIAEGGFSIVHKTTLVDGSSDRDVAIKKLRDSQYFLDELKSFCQLNKAYGVIMCYGITQDPVTEEYMLIMDYAEGGDLHSYLKKNFINITWNDKLNIIEGISFGEMSDSSSNSNGGSFINCEKESTLKKIAELKKKIMKLENTSMKKEKTKRKSNQELVDKESFAITNKTKGLSNQSRLKDKSFNNKSNNKSQPTLSEEDDTEFSSDEPKQESMRLIVAEKLYHLFSTIEYRDMPIIEINKCIDKFCKKNPSFPETVSDWAEREMICQHINYRRSILNLSEMHKTNISVNKAKI
ncbi:kinase-like domain-containing protein [Rhizophagus irregularis DAOM 181602=DAOM 197198]|nr:kinase-like domain-containing protein [Rhizophagus irregularis DAOM 181602=DAOM 197198]